MLTSAVDPDGGRGVAMANRKAVMLALALGAASPIQLATAADPEIGKVGARAIGAYSLDVSNLRDAMCGGGEGSNQDAKNAEFAGCVMYVLGAVDMLREWQKIDPVHAPRVCVPRTA